MSNEHLSRAIGLLGDMPSDWDTVYGVDASLRHGSIVQVKRSAATQTFSWQEVYAWGKNTDSLGEKSPLNEMAGFALKITQNLLNVPRAPVLIEFDPRSVYWRSGKRQIVTLAIFLGYFVGSLHSVGYPSTFITPEESRKFYGFTKGKKEEFQTHFSALTKDRVFPGGPELPKIGSDQLDALLIGLMLWPDDWTFARWIA